MRATLVFHITAGALVLLSGYTALFAPKGARLHRRGGLLFVYAMLGLGLTGTGIALARNNEISIIAGLVVSYLVLTALRTVRPGGAPHTDAGITLAGIAVGATSVVLGCMAIAAGGMRHGMPYFPFFLLGLPALVGGVFDIRMLRKGGLAGVARITRHLWRMTYALFIAALSFFIGQSDEIPAPLRQPALLAAPVLLVLLALVYWVWRVRLRRSFHWAPRGGAPRQSHLRPAS